ncbi:MAG: hypothetical protein WC378_05970 [Opitutaceae bacterium]
MLSPLSVVGQPLFGSQWLALLAILACIAVFLLVVALAGRWLAATHPATPVAAKNQVPVQEEIPLAIQMPTPELMAVISAAVSATFGKKAQIVGVSTLNPPTVESLMVQWSFEGRRQIYSSHKVR